MTENKRYSFNWERGHPNFWDNHCDLADCYLTCEDVVDRLNDLNDENQELKTENKELKRKALDMEMDRDYYRTKSASLEEGYLQLQRENDRLLKENEQYKSLFFELVETALTDKNCRELYCKGILDIFNKANSLNQAREMIKEHLE